MGTAQIVPAPPVLRQSPAQEAATAAGTRLRHGESSGASSDPTMSRQSHKPGLGQNKGPSPNLAAGIVNLK